jgi:two-component system copper resistance phosphate regulon response regulator CusR
MSNINVCLIEDEPQVASVIVDYFSEEDIKVSTYKSAEEFYENHDKNFKGVYLIDWSLPGDPGVNVIKFVRNFDSLSSIFLVTAYSSNEDVLEGLNYGADDYIKKPFNLDELLARVKNASQKIENLSEAVEKTKNEIQLISEAHAFSKDGQTIKLTEREYIIFERLFTDFQDPVSREDLINAFAINKKMVSRNIDVHIFSLRKKLKLIDLYIETVWNFGYKLI